MAEEGPELKAPEKSESELIDIADRMLAKLEREYWEVQNQNISCPHESL